MEQFHWNGIRGSGCLLAACLIGGLLLVGVGMIAVPTFLFVFGGGGARADRMRSAYHPSNDLEAVLLRHDGGATVSFWYTLAIGKDGEDPTRFPVVLEADTVREDDDITFTWIDDHTIRVQISGIVRFFRQVDSIEVGGRSIDIQYRRRYPNES